MPARKKVGGRKIKVGGRKRVSRKVGAGFFGNIGNFFRRAANTVKDAVVNNAGNIVKSGVIGKVANAVDPRLGDAAKTVGLGRRRRRARMGGRGQVTNENVKVMAF